MEGEGAENNQECLKKRRTQDIMSVSERKQRSMFIARGECRSQAVPVI